MVMILMKLKLGLRLYFLFFFMGMIFVPLSVAAATSSEESINEAKRLVANDDLHEAEELLLRALKKDHKNADLYYTLGVVEEAEGQYSEAKRRYSNATRRDKDYLEAYLGWGRMEIELSHPGKAIPVYSKALKLDSENVEIINRLGHLNLAENPKSSKSKNYFEKALKVDAKSRVALSGLAAYYNNIGFKAKAKPYQKRLDALGSSSSMSSPGKIKLKKITSHTARSLENFEIPFDPNIPVKRILVSSFKVAVPELPSGIRVEKGLEAQLFTVLSKCRNFVVIDRDALVDLQSELQLGNAGITSSGTSLRAGKLLGAQVVIRGVVTEFSEHARGKKSGTSINLGQLANAFGAGNSGLAMASPTLRSGKETITGVVGMDIRLTDVETGAVLDSVSVRGELTRKKSRSAFGIAGITSMSEEFEHTVIGQAMRLAIQDAVVKIFERMRKIPWTGYVAGVRPGGMVIINAGSDQNIHMGQRMSIETAGEVVTDPISGIVLYAERKKVAEVEVIQTKDNISFAEVLRGGDVSRGDMVRLK
ncbi:MAG: CsgG/HfaB family protein [Mariprofundaceae bacterium]